VKINRSVKCSLKFANSGKRDTLANVLEEYGNVVNFFIEYFWQNGCVSYSALLKPIVDLPATWLSARLRKVAAREAIGMVKAVKERKDGKGKMPRHSGDRMSVSSTIADFKTEHKRHFNGWLVLRSIGNKIALDLPVKLHKHYHKWASKGKRLNAYIITKNSVQFCFEVETGPKKSPTACIGVDTGINALASLSTGEQLGTDIKSCIERVKRCKHGSKGQKKAVRALKQRMAETAKEVCGKASLVVVENLKGITKNTRRRALGRKTRASIGRWNVRYWTQRLQYTCEETNVSFRTVSPWKTSQTCSSCEHVDRGNRDGEVFTCLKCGRTGNADCNAAVNILSRFTHGKYGSGCKPLPVYTLVH
jgi:IS605 OrfB family transposase